MQSGKSISTYLEICICSARHSPDDCLAFLHARVLDALYGGPGFFDSDVDQHNTLGIGARVGFRVFGFFGAQLFLYRSILHLPCPSHTGLNWPDDFSFRRRLDQPVGWAGTEKPGSRSEPRTGGDAPV